MQRLSLCALLLVLGASLGFTQNIPAGTVIPVMLSTSLDSDKAQPGQPIAGKIMDSVPLAGGGEIPQGAKVFGHVAEVARKDGKTLSVLAVQFDAIEYRGQRVPITASVRAMASMMAVYDAQIPIFEPDTTPRSSIMLAPVGGDAAFRPDNPEKSWGKLVRFSGELPRGCGGRIDQESGTGALWVFSPYACGAYGFGKSLAIASDGSAEPVGAIILVSSKKVDVRGGSGWLLRVGRTGSDSSSFNEQ
jgi:hypothetical protein